MHVSRQPRAVAAWRRAAALLLLCGAAAGGCANSSEEAVEAQFQVHLHEGHLALETGEPADAADAYRRALGVRPGAPEPLLGIARSHSARGDGRSALTVLLELESRHPAYTRRHARADLRFALYQAAKQNLWAGDSARALELSGRLAALEPGHAGLAELRAEATLLEAARLYVGGQVTVAEQLTGRLVGRRVRGRAAALALAEVLVERGRPELAISVLSDGLLRHPDDAALAALMERALDIRYPNGLPEFGTRPEEPADEAADEFDSEFAPDSEGEPEAGLEPEAEPAAQRGPS